MTHQTDESVLYSTPPRTTCLGCGRSLLEDGTCPECGDQPEEDDTDLMGLHHGRNK